MSGKGPPAALLTAMLQGIFWTQSFAPIEPAAMMTRVNQALLARGIENRFATIFFAILSADGRLTYCNAGQNPPMLFSDTFSVGGGGSPLTPLIRTRSGPSSDSSIVSTRSVTSGFAYRAPPIS